MATPEAPREQGRTNSSNTPAQSPEERRVTAWIGQGVSIEGKISSAQDLRIDGKVQGTIEASTSGGSVEATLTRQPEGDCELSTSGGSIHARLSRNLNLNLLASTGGGSVRTNVPVTIRGEVSPRRLDAKMNEGGPVLKLHTMGGSISINAVD